MKKFVNELIDMIAVATTVAMAFAALEGVLMVLLYLYVGEWMPLTRTAVEAWILIDYVAAAIVLIYNAIEKRIFK